MNHKMKLAIKKKFLQGIFAIEARRKKITGNIMWNQKNRNLTTPT